MRRRRKRSDSPNKSPPRAAEIDGAVHVAAHRPLRVGEIATVKIERAGAYDLHGAAGGF